MNVLYEFTKIEIKTKDYAENENPVNHNVNKMILDALLHLQLQYLLLQTILIELWML